MKIYNESITGNENVEELKDVEISALVVFYNAFNERNMDLMETSWLNSDEISMDNPIGGIRRGWDEIKQGYHKIFNGKAKVYVEFYDFSIHKTKDMFFATGREKGFFKVDEIEIPLKIRTTRIFLRSNNVWKQVHHHGSIDDPVLLEEYQKTVVRNG